MISTIKGILTSKNLSNIVIEVNNIGFDLLVSTNTLSSIGNIGETISLHTYLQVKEDGLTLFGFNSKEEKNLFLNLNTVSGIGGKTALLILSGAPLNDLIVSIINKDVSLLSKVKGIGKKTAERIILELSEKLSETAMVSLNNNITNFDAMTDAVSALNSLGINKSEAQKLARIYAEQGDSAEDIITKILQGLGK